MTDSPHVFHVTTETFSADVMEASFQQPVLVDFWAKWCEPCKQLIPVLEKLAVAYQGAFRLGKVDCDQEQTLAAQVGVRSLPTVMLVKDGQLVDQFSGALPESEVKAMLDKHVSMPESSPRDQAKVCLERGDFVSALPFLERAYQETPDDTDLAIDLARALFHSGNMAKAETILASLPESSHEDDRVKGIVAQRAFAEQIRDVAPIDVLETRLGENPEDTQARFNLALRLVVSGDYAPAMEHLLYLIRNDPTRNGGEARATLLGVFSLLGSEHPLARPYRQKLFQLMY